MRRAVRAWNGAGLSIRFARAPRSQADVTFRYFRRGPRCGGGIPGLGWPGPDAPPVPIYLARRCPVAGIRALTVAHELGHVLGLAHENRVCALMNPFHLRGGGSRCDQSRAAVRARYRTLLEPDDVEGALHLYGPRS